MALKTSFAAAQESLLQRRKQREQGDRPAHALVAADSSASRAQVRPLLRRAVEPTARAWNQIKGREGTRPLFRVGQVDAELLDEELFGLFSEQIREALKYCGSQLRDDWSHEIHLALRAVLFKLSIWDHNASYGAALQNLKYIDARSKGPVHTDPTRWQKALYGLFTVGGRYAWDKWESRLLDQESSWEEPTPRSRLFSRLTQSLSTLHTTASFLSFLVFLVNGHYRTLTDRLLRMRLSPPSAQVSREVSFEYLNRQLVWHAFTEFLLFLLPLVGISRWRRWLARAWRRAVSALRASAAAGDPDAPPEKQRGELAFLPERTCAVCYRAQNPAAQTEADVLAASSRGAGGLAGSAQTDVVNPYEAMPCGCIYCFVCIAQVLEGAEGEGWVCLRCGELVKQCQPWRGDVLVEEARPIGEAVQKPHDGQEKLGGELLQPASTESSPARKSVEFVEEDEVISDEDISSDDEDYDEKEAAEDSGNPWSSDGEVEEDDEDEDEEEQEVDVPRREDDEDDVEESRVMFGGR